MDYAEFGRLLRNHRSSAGLSLRRLAQRAYVNHGSLSHAESGDQHRRLSHESVQAVDTALDARGELIQAWQRLPAQAGRWPQLIPNQLPPAPNLFGRDTLLSEIIELAGQPDQTSPTLVLLTGPGGVGKTALAITAAHQLAEAAGTGALINDMRGWHETTAPRSPWDVLHRWCRALGAGAGEAGGDHDDLVALWRSMTAERHIIAVIDNARADQVADLVPSSPESTIIVTSRDRMIDAAVPPTARLSVPPLDKHDALDVLALHSGMPAHVLDPLADRCAGLPLALRVAGEDAGAHWQAEEIVDMAQEWDLLPQQDAVNRATAQSYRRLSSESAQAWRLLAHVGDPSLGAAAAALNVTASRARRLLHEATRANLLDRAGSSWTYHDLHRSYAIDVSRSQDADETIAETVYRSLVWYLHGLSNADTWFAARDDQPEIVALPEGIEPPEFGSYDEAFEWVDARWSSLVHAVQTAVSHGWAALAWQLAAIHVHWSFLVKPWHSWAQACHAAGGAAREHGDLNGQAWMEHILGSIAGDQDNYNVAIRHTDAALELRRHLGDPRDIGWVAVNAVRWRLATDAAERDIRPLVDEVINNHSSIGMQAGVCLGHTFRAMLDDRAGDHTNAIEHLNQALVGLDELDDPAVYCYVYTTLAQVEVQAGRLLDAREHAQQSDAYALRSGADWFRIGALAAEADTYNPSDAGERDRLWTTLHMAVTLCDKLGDPREPHLRERLDDLDRSASSDI